MNPNVEYEKLAVQELKFVIQQSPNLNNSQKLVLENLLDKMVGVMENADYL